MVTLIFHFSNDVIIKKHELEHFVKGFVLRLFVFLGVTLLNPEVLVSLHLSVCIIHNERL